MTDGMAIRELMTGRTFDIFVLDEAHERSINTDVLMALLKGQMKRKTKKIVNNIENI
jgi:HrpA-like RNA helicase